MPIIDSKIEALAHKAPEIELSLDQLDEIASLAYRITRVVQERAGIPIEPIHARAYHEKTSGERAAMRVGALRVLQALILLDYIEMPAVVLPGE